jgi:transposase
VGETDYEHLIASDAKAAAKLLVEKDRQIQLLTNHLINANKQRFGTKSEKLPVGEQGTLFTVDEPLEAVPSSEEPERTPVSEHTRSTARKRRTLPEGTVVKRIEHPPVETECAVCGSELVQLREEITKMVNFIPAHFELQEHARPVMACACCKESAPVTTPLPSGIQLIPRSPVGVGLLTSILISKYQDHLPLYRQEEMFARLGYEVPRKRMCEWLGALAELCQPLYKAMKRVLVAEGYLQADETTVKIQDNETPGKCHTGYFWGLSPPERKLVYFHYAASRAGEVPRAILSDFKGILQTDLYAGYNEVYVPDKAVRAGCWAHVRRKFIEIEKLAGKDVKVALETIAKLYKAEPKDREPELVQATRSKVSAPLVHELHGYLTSWSKRTLPRSPVQKAIQYALTQWEALTLFLTHPHVMLDNNPIENQMRPIALGRKNWLFAGSHEGAMRAAIFFSLINSCRLNKVNTWEYFTDVLPRLGSTRSENLPALLPNTWKPLVKDGA